MIPDMPIDAAMAVLNEYLARFRAGVIDSDGIMRDALEKGFTRKDIGWLGISLGKAMAGETPITCPMCGEMIRPDMSRYLR